MKVQTRIIIILLLGLLLTVSAFSVAITNIYIGSSPNNYTTVIANVGSEISVDNGSLVFYVSSATNTEFCFNIVSSSTPVSLESMCVDKGKYVHIGKYLIYYLGNNSGNLGIFISNGILPTVLLNLGNGPFYVNKNIQIEVVPMLGPKANISLTVRGNNGKLVIKYPYFTEDNCQGDNCKMLINFKPTNTGQYNIKVTDCYNGFCVFNQTNITVTNKETKQNNGKVSYICQIYSLETGRTYSLYKGKLLIIPNQIVKPQYSSSMIVDIIVNNQLFNLKPNQGEARVGDFNITVINVTNLTETSPKEIGVPEIVYYGTVVLRICKKEISGTLPSLLKVYINVNNKYPKVGSTVKITAGVSYIESLLANLYIYTPDDKEIELGPCTNSKCVFNTTLNIQKAGDYVIKLHYCLATGCYNETAIIHAGVSSSPNGQSNSSNVIKIFKPGIYIIPTNTTVIIYTPNKIYKLFFDDIEKRLGTKEYFTVIDYGSAMYNGYENKTVFSNTNFTLTIEKITPTDLLYSKCVTVENCYSHYKGKVEIYVKFSKKLNGKLLTIGPGVNILYPGVYAQVPLEYFKKYCKSIVEIDQLTTKGWISSSNINLDTVLFIANSGGSCFIPIPATPKAKSIKNVNLLLKTLNNSYTGYQTNNLRIYLS